MVSAADRKIALRFIVCIGVVSLFADMTYEGAYSGTGPLLKDLGVTAAAAGFVAGFGEMAAASLRYFSGKLADRTRAYWTLVFLGYLLNLIAIPAISFAGSWQMVAFLVVVERTGKAIRGPARDVILSEATGMVGHGWGFGIHAAMDQTGAVIGPLFVAWSVARSHTFGPAFFQLGIPAVLALAALGVARHYRPRNVTPPSVKPPQPLPNVFWIYVLASGLLAAGFLDFTLLSFHFQATQLFQPETIPLLYAGAMGIVGLTALVCGRLFDRYGVIVLALGVVVTMLAVPFGFLGGQAGGVLAVALWAAGHGVQDATMRSGIAQVVSMNKRGSAFGAFNGIFGVMWFLGSVVMGLLYDRSLIALVVFGLAFQIASAALFFWLRRPLAAAAAAN